MFFKIRVLKNFAKFAGKNLNQSLFFNCDFIKKETLAQVFSCKFYEEFKNTFFSSTTLVNTSETQIQKRLFQMASKAHGYLSSALKELYYYQQKTKMRLGNKATASRFVREWCQFGGNNIIFFSKIMLSIKRH